MQIKVDFSTIDRFVEYLNQENCLNEDCKQGFVKSLHQSESFNQQLKFYKGKITSEEYFDTIFAALENKELKTTNEVLKVMYNSWKNILNRREILEKKVDNLRKYDFAKLERKLLDTLPENTSLNIKIYFVFDGFNAGSIVSESDMLLDALFWPSDMQFENQINGIILHEYHHLGFIFWLSKNERRNQLVNKNDGQKLVVKLVESIISEGMATYFFNQNDELNKLLEDSYGEIYANAYLDSINRAKTDICSFIYELDNDLNYLLSNQDDYDQMRKRIAKYSFSAEYGQPLDKAIGSYMCEIIHRDQGISSLIDSIINPNTFLSKYNESVSNSNGMKLNEKTIDDWLKIWK